MREKFYTTNLPPEAKRLISSILQIYRRRPCVNIYTLKIYRLFKQRIQAQTMKMGRIFKKCFSNLETKLCLNIAETFFLRIS
jgi:hypothetical protein